MSAGEQEQAQQAAEAQTESASLVDAAITATEKAGKVERDEATALVRTAVEEALQGVITWDKDAARSLGNAIKAIDAKITEQLAVIMHDDAFQKLEGSWRGLHHLVMNSETGEQLKIRVFNASKRDVFKDLDKAAEFDQSQLFKKIYESEFGSPGGHPYGALIGDYEFENHPEDLDMLSKISGIAAAGFCPFISAADPKFVGLDSFEQLPNPRDLAKIFEQKKYIQWKSFRDSEDSRFVTLTLPRTLARLPYGKTTKIVEEFDFQEAHLDKDGSTNLPMDHDDFCWMNTAYVLGAKLTDAFAKTGFCTAIRGKENGGLVEGLPTYIFKDADGDEDQKCPTEIGITDRREKELSDLGFVALSHNKNTDYSVFYGGQTAQKPKKYDRPEATANANISARLPYIMAMSRFSHYLKVMARDKIGSFKERQDVEDWLDRWIKNYVTTDPSPSEDVKARFPLAEAKVEVLDVPGQPGSYQAKVHMRPWLQMEELTTTMYMVAKLPGQAGS